MSLKNVEKTQEIKAFFDAFALPSRLVTAKGSSWGGPGGLRS
jgi:hypothetical protein